MVYFSDWNGHLGSHFEFLQLLFYFIFKYEWTVSDVLTVHFPNMLQNNTDMDVLQDNNKLRIVEDIELNGLNTSIEYSTAYKVALNVLNRQFKIKYSKGDNL